MSNRCCTAALPATCDHVSVAATPANPARHRARAARGPYQGEESTRAIRRVTRRRRCPVTLGETRDRHGLRRTELEAAIGGRTDRHAFQEPLRVDVEQFLAVAAPYRLIAAARGHDVPSQRRRHAAHRDDRPSRFVGHEREPAAVRREARVAFRERLVQQRSRGGARIERNGPDVAARHVDDEEVVARRPVGRLAVRSRAGQRLHRSDTVGARDLQRRRGAGA